MQRSRNLLTFVETESYWRDYSSDCYINVRRHFILKFIYLRLNLGLCITSIIFNNFNISFFCAHLIKINHANEQSRFYVNKYCKYYKNNTRIFFYKYYNLKKGGDNFTTRPIFRLVLRILIVIHDEEDTSTLNLGQTGNLQTLLRISFH